MKLYLITHTGKTQWYKLEAWADIEKVGESGVCVKSVKAFTKLKYAKEYLKKYKCDHLIIKSVVIN